MKSLLIILAFFLATAQCTLAQSDSSAYQLQRKKINDLLSQRSEKFGQYDQSLQLQTGIFGLKTKKDMQRSNDILTDIVLNDNTIFKELKILLDFKDLEKSTIESRSTQNQYRIGKYMETITKLQNEQDRLQRDIKLLEKSRLIYKWVIFISLLIGSVLAYFILMRNKLIKD